MTKLQKLKTCDWALALLYIPILLSSIQLEATEGRELWSIWLHVVLGVLFLGCGVLHIYLHFGWKAWFGKFKKQKSVVTKILWWLFLLTLLSGIIAFIHWVGTFVHSSLGGVHGKLGFLMLLVCILHAVKRYKFFKFNKRK